MNLIIQGGNDQAESPESCRVAVMYGDLRSREAALELHDRLQRRFWQELDLQFSWWNFRYLGEAGIAELAGRAVQSANIVLFALRRGSELTHSVRQWLETWFAQRQNQAGALAALVERSREAGSPPAPLDSYLSVLAQKTGLDYLPLVEIKPARPQLPGLVASTSALDEAMRHPAFSHWGLNE